jgi:hypothetical protein
MKVLAAALSSTDFKWVFVNNSWTQNQFLPKKLQNPEQLVILNSRQAATNFRRWVVAESARAACQLILAVTE